MASALYLEGVNDKYQLVTSAAAAVDVFAAFVDWLAGAVTPKSPQLTAITTATTTDIVAAPAASTVRSVKAIHIRNKDATVATDVTVVIDRSGTDYEIHKVTLQPGEALEWTEATGWFTFAPAPRLDMLKYVTADSVHATAATFADITGLTFPVIAGRTYALLCALQAITNATTTGAQFAIGGVAMTAMRAWGRSVLLGSPTASSTNTTGVATAINTAVMAQTTGAATEQPHEMSAGFTPSASGTFAVRATSEVTVANGLIVRARSWAWLRETNN